MNILLHKLPTEYKGYKINTDFRIGIQISILFTDNTISEDDKLDQAIDLLWGSGVPTTLTDDGIIVDYALITETINWFMLCGKDPKEKFSFKKDKNGEKGDLLVEDIAYDFDVDDIYIYAAFIQQYGIDLTKTNMHWFKFNALFSAIRDCTFSDLQEIRMRDPLDYEAGKQRAAVMRQKENYRIRKESRVTPERRAQLEMTFGSEWREHI